VLHDPQFSNFHAGTESVAKFSLGQLLSAFKTKCTHLARQRKQTLDN